MNTVPFRLLKIYAKQQNIRKPKLYSNKLGFLISPSANVKCVI